MKCITRFSLNGFLPLIPILIWNSIFFSKLPAPYQEPLFSHNIPGIITYGETIFRILIFTLPLLFTISMEIPLQKKGWIIFIIGLTLYCISWLLLIYMPDFSWSKSLVGFTAPAYTPLIWLIGLGLIVDKGYFFKYSKFHYLLPALFFTFFHVYHAIYVYSREY